MRRILACLGAAITLVALAWAGNVAGLIGIAPYMEQVLAVILGLALAHIFLARRARRRDAHKPPSALDIVAAVTSAVVCGYIAVRYPVLAEEMFYRPQETFVIGFTVVILVTEALRRRAGLSLVVVFLCFLAYGLFGHLIPGELQGKSLSFVGLLGFLGVDGQSLFGTPLTVVANIVIAFVFMGHLLLRSGGADFFTEISAALMGRSRGGAAKIAIVASALFGSISGSAVSNVASTGVITIPLMKRTGYAAHTSAAIEAVASTGGQIMPPIMGAAAFLMAEFLQIQYSEVVIAALVPAILYYVAVFVQVDLEAERQGIAALAPEELPSLGPVLRSGWFFLVPFVVLLVALFSFNAPPEKGALYASVSIVVCSLLFGYKGRRVTAGDVREAIVGTGHAVTDIVVICAIAGMIIGILTVTGLGFGLTFVLVQFGEGNLVLLLVVSALVCILLGMSMPTVSLYVLLSALVAPPLVELGVQPLAAHLFVLYFGLLSMITPPVALAAFTAANIARAGTMRTAFVALRLGWPAYIVPFLFVFSPSLLLDGGIVEIVLACTTAVAGVWLCSASIVGFCFGALGLASRVLLAVAGLALLAPAQLFPGAIWLEIGGAALAAAVFFRERVRRRAARAAARG
ncbi:MAG: TRAP transporter fused permease subunit [Rhodospirillaceae bacterium]